MEWFLRLSKGFQDESGGNDDVGDGDDKQETMEIDFTYVESEQAAVGSSVPDVMASPWKRRRVGSERDSDYQYSSPPPESSSPLAMEVLNTNMSARLTVLDCLHTSMCASWNLLATEP